MKTSHFGREGKVAFPDQNSIEVDLVEKKLVKYGLIKEEETRKANLQVKKLNLRKALDSSCFRILLINLRIGSKLIPTMVDSDLWYRRLPHPPL